MKNCGLRARRNMIYAIKNYRLNFNPDMVDIIIIIFKNYVYFRANILPFNQKLFSLKA